MDIPSHMLCCERNGILCHYRLSSRRVRSDKHAIAHLQPIYCLLLEVVELERILRVSKWPATPRLIHSPGEPSRVPARGTGVQLISLDSGFSTTHIGKTLSNINDMSPLFACGSSELLSGCGRGWQPL
jgi:hypothetical protein